MAFEKIIVLDDELFIRKSLEEQLRKKKYTVATASTIEQARKYLSKDNFDLIFVDVRLPDGDGRELLEELSQVPDSPMVVIMTGFGTIESAVECMRKGAFDYLIKPFSLDAIEVILDKAENYNRLIRVNQFYNKELQSDSTIIGESKAMVRLKEMVKKVAATEATVLITGENGTGKELVAQDLYRLSSRDKQPFIKVNCAAISETLMESEFFGHEKGAFTGASQRREGRFELANQGTILLDEISEISLHLQAKLLRVLQEREFERVGGNQTIHVDVRVIATTNRNLLEQVKHDRFREDLYYRLNVFPIEVPPLRDRGDDVLLLADEFLGKFSQKHNLTIPGYTKEALSVLRAHTWPGNVRELQNTIERAVILSENNKPVQANSLGLTLQVGQSKAPIFSEMPEEVSATGQQLPLKEMEREYIASILKSTDNNVTQAAEILDLSAKELRAKLKSYGLANEKVVASS
ncbi:MAG: sigma-54-dependent Fis family transcriptional regulator [Verrucomicrobia bacterium CG_4_10_14_3_um_filter_43_23]|nr:MAG: sigma-54-dependent Fis family transcriptional regulator [Verrucomicrobia bacterium CG1_02_43_26]PIP59091.1 MAG: sigma-54-dependent Fis family transcriptional regulator [Verrucomicrobia bacterium CG22_combo_CG10-13_8_21_14_all_43_17]PIX58228.1 MAG: sigma-54-dependent Fis family transcriptional regulator [Verrucomicrobia bacterium CG_4_10_14_3_um_filter_43_23]PIY62354.1 MAG: sigma-54-dependent Fis family transcriptional regulator [Verrucomicrobia bacterium CG_4_10_14_0_8_um_filter_43_34]P